MKGSATILTGDIIKRERSWRKVKRYLIRYEREIEKEAFIPFEDKAVNDGVKINKTIWVCWFQGLEYAPTIIKKCVESIEKNKPEDFEIRYLTYENIHNYIMFPQSIENKLKRGIIGRTHFSDLVRTELLYLYGGLWIDATVYCAETIPKYMCSGELFAFRWSLLDSSAVSISSWWLYTRQKGTIITDTRNMLLAYWNKEKRLRDYYLFHIIFSIAKEHSAVNQNIFSDMIYRNNSEPQILFGKLGKVYDPKEWGMLREHMPIQKLSYKKRIIQGDIYNYYTALLDGKLGTGGRGNND